MTTTYKDKVEIYRQITPSVSDINTYTLENLTTDLDDKFKFKDTIITVFKKGEYDFYPVTFNEVLSLLDYYKIKKLKNINIRAYEQIEIQGFVKSDGSLLTLIIPNPKFKPDKTLKYKCMFILLHEISHLLGNMDEPEADRFADMEIGKWQRFMHF